MKNYKETLLEEGEYKGFHYFILHNRNGYRCGYIIVPPEHEWFGLEYDDIGADVHGGLTYGELEASEYWLEHKGKHIIGFDCAHLYDLQDPTLPSTYTDSVQHEGTIKTTIFVRSELHKLIDQAI
jgi:hypothetical protein